MQPLRFLLPAVSIALLFQATPSAASEYGTSSKTQWWIYNGKDIADDKEMHHQYGIGDGDTWTHFINPRRDEIKPNFLFFGPYLNFNGTGDIDVDITLRAHWDPAKFPIDSGDAIFQQDWAHVEITADAGARTLDYINLNVGRNAGLDRLENGPRGIGHLHLYASNVTDTRNFEVRMSAIMGSAFVEIRSIKIMFVKH